MAYAGRGSWTKVGGTLTFDKKLGKTVPGPYYMVSVNSDMMGLKVYKQLKAGVTPDINEYAVFLGVKEIQRRLNATGAKLDVDGLLGKDTDAVIKKFQTANGLEADGIIGPSTATKLILPELKVVSKKVGADWTVVAGLIKRESQFDPGAVGYYDSNDIGLGQINGPSNPGLSMEDRANSDIAVDYVARRLLEAIEVFGGNVRDAIASYNLGVGGARSWIKAGRPATWTPAGMTVPRDVKGYIDEILNAF